MSVDLAGMRQVWQETWGEPAPKMYVCRAAHMIFPVRIPSGFGQLVIEPSADFNGERVGWNRDYGILVIFRTAVDDLGRYLCGIMDEE